MATHSQTTRTTRTFYQWLISLPQNPEDPRPACVCCSSLFTTNAFVLQNMIFHKVQTSANALTGSSCFHNHLHIPMHMNSQSYQILTLLYLPSLLLAYIAICVSFAFCIKFYTQKKENRGNNCQSIPCDHVALPILIFTAYELMSQDTLHTSGSM